MHRQVQLNIRPFPITDKDWKKISYTAKAFIIIGIIAVQFFSAYFAYTSRPQAPEMAGIYHVEEFSLNNKSVAPLITNNHRWQRVVVDDQRAGLVAVDYWMATELHSMHIYQPKLIPFLVSNWQRTTAETPD